MVKARTTAGSSVRVEMGQRAACDLDCSVETTRITAGKA